MRLIELLHGDVKLVAYLALHEELGDLRAALRVLWLYLANLALFSCSERGLRLHGPEDVLGKLALVLSERFLCFAVPHLALLLRHVRPCQADDGRERRVVCFN